MAQKFGVELHAAQALSTHLHEVVTDVRAKLPAFERERNRLLANALKCHRGWPEEVFQRARPSYVRLHGPDAIAKQIGYTLANCVEAGLVSSPEQWPGVTVRVDDIGQRVIEVERPPMYFDPDNPAWPERVTIPITMPAALLEAYGEGAREVLRAAVRAAVERARAIAIRAGRFVRGPVAKLFKVPITRRSNSFEPFGERDPTFATGGNRERAREARTERRVFIGLYRAALAALRSGVSNVRFPEGTWRWARELLPASLRSPGPAVVA
jgi:hypothetical protein